MVRASRRDGASSKENSLNSNAAREAPTYGGAVQSNRFYRDYEPPAITAKHGGARGRCAGLLCAIFPAGAQTKIVRDTVPSDTNENNIIRLSNLDQPLYRVYALDRFEQLLATKDDALLNPTKREDPFENFFLEATEVIDPPKRGHNLA